MRVVKEVRDKLGPLAVGAGGEPPEQPPTQKIVGYPARVRRFLHDVRLEMRNVTWPTRADVRATTVVVLIATFFFGFYLGLALDVPFARLMSWLLHAGQEWIK